MKEFFKYDNGYVNINDENLFLTNSGNWSEIVKIEEKSTKTIRQNNFKGFKIYLFLFIIFCLFLVFISKSKGFILPFGFLVIGFAAFVYMRKETGNKYKIPISKITAIRVLGNEVKISFLNSNNEEDFETIHKVENKGLHVLAQLIQTVKK
jgi:hypothetical protein